MGQNLHENMGELVSEPVTLTNTPASYCMHSRSKGSALVSCIVKLLKIIMELKIYSYVEHIRSYIKYVFSY